MASELQLPCGRACWRRFSVIRALLLLLLSNSLLDLRRDRERCWQVHYPLGRPHPREASSPDPLDCLDSHPCSCFFCGLSFLFASTVLFSSIHSVSGLVVVLHPLAGILDHLLADVHQTEELLRPEN